MLLFCQIGDDVDPFGVLVPPLSRSTVDAQALEPTFRPLIIIDRVRQASSPAHRSNTSPPPPTP
jgi:hypothetical protein